MMVVVTEFALVLVVCRNLNKNQYGEVVLSGKIQDFCHSNDITQLRKHLAEGRPATRHTLCHSVCLSVCWLAGRSVGLLVIR